MHAYFVVDSNVFIFVAGKSDDALFMVAVLVSCIKSCNNFKIFIKPIQTTNTKFVGLQRTAKTIKL